MTDPELLAQYRESRCEAAFGELVARHVHWVRSAALRQTRDGHLADDVTQAVFIALARKAPRLRHDSAIAGWLFQATRYASCQAVRTEIRRKRHERRAAAMVDEACSPVAEAEWRQLAPALDELVAGLRKADRQAVLLRFYEGKSFGEVGEALGVSEEAARKRTDRAVEKLRMLFGRRGTAVASSAGLSATLVAYTTQPADAGLVAVTSGKALGATGPVAAGLGQGWSLAQGALRMMAWAKFKAAAALVVAAALGAGSVGTAAMVMAWHAAPGVSPGANALAADRPASRPVPQTWGDLARGMRAALEQVATIGVDQTLNGAAGRRIWIDKQQGIYWSHDNWVEVTGTDGVVWRTRGKATARARFPSTPAAVLDGVVLQVGVTDPAAKVTREASADEAIDGVRCEAYRIDTGSSPIVWVDPEGLLRRKRLGNAPFTVIQDLHYDQSYKPILFQVAPSALAAAVDSDASFQQRYPQAGALWQQQIGPHLVAVHAVERDTEGRIYLTLSTRLDEQARREAPPLYQGLAPFHWLMLPRAILDLDRPKGRLYEVGSAWGDWWFISWLVFEPREILPEQFEIPVTLEPFVDSWLKSRGYETRARVHVPVPARAPGRARTFAQVMESLYDAIAATEVCAAIPWMAFSEKDASGHDTIGGRRPSEQTRQTFTEDVRTILRIPMRFPEPAEWTDGIRTAAPPSGH